MQTAFLIMPLALCHSGAAKRSPEPRRATAQDKSRSGVRSSFGASVYGFRARLRRPGMTADLAVAEPVPTFAVIDHEGNRRR